MCLTILTSPIGVRLVYRRGVVKCLVEGQSRTNEANAHLCNLYKCQWGRISKTGRSTNSYGLILNSSKLSMTGGTKDVCIPAYKFEQNSTLVCYLLDSRVLAPHWQVKVISVAAPFLVIHLLQTLCLNLTVIVSWRARRHLNKINKRPNSGFCFIPVPIK